MSDLPGSGGIIPKHNRDGSKLTPSQMKQSFGKDFHLRPNEISLRIPSELKHQLAVRTVSILPAAA